MPTLTLGWLTLINASAAEVIDAAAKTGFRSVSIRITGRKTSDNFPTIVGDRAALAELKRRLDDGGLTLSNTSVYHLSPDITLEMLKPCIEATVELGAKIIVATCTDRDYGRWSAFMSRYAELAHAAGLKLALEFVPFSEARTVEAGLDLVRRVNAPNFGLLVDPLHLSRSGGTPADLAKVDPRHIVFAQLCDAVAERPPFEGLPNEARTGRLYPGEGALPLYEFLDALPDGCEVEIEAPINAFRDLGALEQARRAADAFRRYLDSYCRARNRAAWN